MKSKIAVVLCLILCAAALFGCDSAKTEGEPAGGDGPETGIGPTGPTVGTRRPSDRPDSPGTKGRRPTENGSPNGTDRRRPTESSSPDGEKKDVRPRRAASAG